MVVAVDAVEDPVGEVDLVVPGGGVAPLPPLLQLAAIATQGLGNEGAHFVKQDATGRNN